MFLEFRPRDDKVKGFENVFEGMDVLVDSMLSGALSSVINRVHGCHKVQRPPLYY